MLLKEKSMEKPSLIPRAERRKGACNCLHGQHCGGSPEGLPIAYYDIYWSHPQCDCRIVTVLVWLYKEMRDRWINSSKEIVNTVLPMPSSVSCTGKAGCPCWPAKNPLSLQLQWRQGLGASKNEMFGGNNRILSQITWICSHCFTSWDEHVSWLQVLNQGLRQKCHLRTEMKEKAKERRSIPT